jgi:hypothetical protein
MGVSFQAAIRSASVASSGRSAVGAGQVEISLGRIMRSSGVSSFIGTGASHATAVPDPRHSETGSDSTVSLSLCWTPTQTRTDKTATQSKAKRVVCLGL